MFLTKELSKKINNEIKFGISKIAFLNVADKDDTVQNCWLSILLYMEKHEKITRLAIKGKVKNEMIKYFNSRHDASFNDEIAYKTNDLVDEIIERDKKNAKLLEKESRFEKVEKKIPGVFHLNEKPLSPRFHKLSKNLDYGLYRELRNKKEYLMRRFVGNLREYSVHEEVHAGGKL